MSEMGTATWFEIEEDEKKPMATQPNAVASRLSIHHKSLISDDTRQAARALRMALEPFKELSATMPVAYVITLLAVAEEEGKGVSEYSRDTGIYKTVMTRHLLDLGPRDRHGGEGLDLLEQKRDVKDLRVNRTYINHKGAQLLGKVKRALELFVR